MTIPKFDYSDFEGISHPIIYKYQGSHYLGIISNQISSTEAQKLTGYFDTSGNKFFDKRVELTNPKIAKIEGVIDNYPPPCQGSWEFPDYNSILKFTTSVIIIVESEEFEVEYK